MLERCHPAPVPVPWPGLARRRALNIQPELKTQKCQTLSTSGIVLPCPLKSIWGENSRHGPQLERGLTSKCSHWGGVKFRSPLDYFLYLVLKKNNLVSKWPGSKNVSRLTELAYDGHGCAHHAIPLLQTVGSHSNERVCNGGGEQHCVDSDDLKKKKRVRKKEKANVLCILQNRCSGQSSSVSSPAFNNYHIATRSSFFVPNSDIQKSKSLF